MSKLTGLSYGVEEIAIAWGSREVAARLRRTARRVLKIEIDPDGLVTVFAPTDASYQAIVQRCQRKGKWVFRELDRMSARPVFTPERRYLSGETHLFIGKHYRLAVERSVEPFVRTDGARLILGVREPGDSAHCRRLLMAFYTREAQALFPVRLNAMLPPVERKGVSPPHLNIRRMTKRWGSYTPTGNLTLNVDLVRAGLNLIDYVICHELAHAFHGDHGEEWRNLLFSMMPDWEQRKLELELTLR